MVLLAAALIAVVPAGPSASASGGTVYYVNSQTGSDSNNGTSPSSPWQSLAKVDAATFQPGDSILLADGSEWSGAALSPQGSGASSDPITIGDYGTGALPEIDGDGQVPAAVQLTNQQHWTIEDIAVTNAAPATGTPGANLGNFTGIWIGGDDGQTLSGFVVNGVSVSDVTGVDNWIGGSTSGDRPGINFDTGWDASKDTGGIVFQGTVADPTDPGQPTVLNDMTVENSTIENTSWGGIITKQYTGSNAGAVATGWGTRTGTDDPSWAPLTNLTIQGNYITQSGTAYGSNGMDITSVQGATIQQNVVNQVGTSGIECDYCDSVTIQHNEVEGTTVKAGGGDSNAIDTDMGTTNMLVQYNYLHNNGYGFLIFPIVFAGSSTWRYNVVSNSTSAAVLLGGASGSVANVYNNTFYNTTSTMISTEAYSMKFLFENNAFYSTVASPAIAQGAGLTYTNNYYGGPDPTIPSGDTAAVTGDPRFTNPAVNGPYGTATSGPELATADAYEQLSGSALVDTGMTVSDNGGVDYAGNALYNHAPDIGAFEYRTAPGASGEAIDGTVTSTSSGQPLGGARVTVEAAGTSVTATSESDGFYSALDVPFSSSVTVTATAPGYATDATTTSVTDGDSTRLDLSLTPTTTTGTIHGQVDDDQAAPVGGATVTLTRAGQTVTTTTSDSTGAYSFDAVTAASGYDVTATDAGFRSASDSNVTVSIAATSTPDVLMLPTTDGTVLRTHDFSGLPTGPLTTGSDGWTASSAGGSVDVVTDAPGTNQSLQLRRTTNNGATSAELAFATPLKGLVTISADVERLDTTGSAADYFAIPYVWGPGVTPEGSGSTPGVAVASSQGAIEAYEGSTIHSLTSYTPDTWYHLSLVIDTVNQDYDLYVNGNEVVTDAPFRTAMSAVSIIQFYANNINYGTLRLDNVQVGYGLNPLQSAAPAKAQLSTTQGWTDGLKDGYYDVDMNMWSGNNATGYSLYQNGSLLYTEPLLDGGTAAQSSTVEVSGLPDGTYVYTGVLTNSAGATATSSATVHVTDANPGTPVLSDSGYDGATSTTVTTDMWWGTNASEYQLYLDGELIDTQQITGTTPNPQQVTTALTGLTPGKHRLVAVLSNQFGSTDSAPLTLDVGR